MLCIHSPRLNWFFDFSFGLWRRGIGIRPMMMKYYDEVALSSSWFCCSWFFLLCCNPGCLLDANCYVQANKHSLLVLSSAWVFIVQCLSLYCPVLEFYYPVLDSLLPWSFSDFISATYDYITMTYEFQYIWGQHWSLPMMCSMLDELRCMP